MSHALLFFTISIRRPEAKKASYFQLLQQRGFCKAFQRRQEAPQKMDRTLNREEAKELMKLLGLDMSCWGNVPMMRRHYLIKCKQYHPDKGGNEELMKRLNALYLKLEDAVCTIQKANEEEENSWSSSQVLCHGPCCDYQLMAHRIVGALFGEVFTNMVMKDWDQCVLSGGDKLCDCFHCILALKHYIKSKGFRKPQVWVECYCYLCYRRWFGLPLTWESFFWWKKILYWTPMCETGLAR